MTPTTLFHGTDAERTALLDAIAHNCTCVFDMAGALITSCPPHRALFEDQHFLDGVLAERRRSEDLQLEEFSYGAPWEKGAPYRWWGELQK